MVMNQKVGTYMPHPTNVISIHFDAAASMGLSTKEPGGAADTQSDSWPKVEKPSMKHFDLNHVLKKNIENA